MSATIRNGTLAIPIDWSRFEVEERDLEVVYNLLLEREVPLTTEQMAWAIVERRLAAQAAASVAPHEPSTAYLPRGRFPIGASIFFPALGGAAGVVVGEREGVNPALGPFKVIRVRFGEGGETREFAAALAGHRLNQVAETPAPSDGAD